MEDALGQADLDDKQGAAVRPCGSDEEARIQDRIHDPAQGFKGIGPVKFTAWQVPRHVRRRPDDSEGKHTGKIGNPVSSWVQDYPT